MKRLELYVHVPFCIKKCSYCDFLSAPAQEEARQAYMDQLLNEIHAAAGRYRDYKITTIFIGGGTPSVLSVSQIKQLLLQLRRCFAVHADAEISIECNPGTLDAQKLAGYLESGINRLSIGLQSADPKELLLLGRIHTFEQFLENYCLARKMGFKNINIDLIFSLPGEKCAVYEQTLKKVIDLKPEHISAYSLIIEEGTPFYDRFAKAERLRKQGLDQDLLPKEEEEHRMYQMTRKLLNSAGYDRYEISNYAKKGYACRHNIGYWMRENYLGLGLGAASLVENVRFSNTRDLKKYLAMDFAAMEAGADKDRMNRKVYPGWSEERNPLAVYEQMEEFMFLGLRMTRGVSSNRFYRQFSKRIEAVYGQVLEKQLKDHLIKKTAGGYCLTDYGIAVSNYVMAAYLMEKETDYGYFNSSDGSASAADRT